MLKAKLFPIQQRTVNDIVNTFHGAVGHCSNGKIVCLPFGEGKTLTALESSRLISESLKTLSGRTRPTHGPVLFITQRTIVETLVTNSTQHYSPPLKPLFVTRGETNSQNPDHQTWYSIKDIDVLIVTYETLVSIYGSVASARMLILSDALRQKSITAVERAMIFKFMAAHEKHPNLNEPLPLERLRHLEKVDNSSTITMLLFMHRWPVVVMDECHEARNISSMTFKAVSQLRASFRIGLSATLFNNNINDVISMFMLMAIPPPPTQTDAIDVEACSSSRAIALGSASIAKRLRPVSEKKTKPSVRTCVHDYCVLLNDSMPCAIDTFGTQEDDTAIDTSSSHNTDAVIARWMQLASTDEEALCRAFVACRDLYIVQKSIEEVRSHYQPTDVIVHMDFCTPEERNFYEMVASKTAKRDADIGRLLRSRLAASSLYHERDIIVALCDDDEILVPYGESRQDALTGRDVRNLTVNTPSKIKAVVALLATPISRGEKSVIFAHFIHSVRQFQDAIAKAHSVKVFVVLATASTTQRDTTIAACKNYRGPAVLVSTKILSQGCDLSFANHIFQTGVWWNDVNEKQSRARIERPDQTRSVFSFQVIMKNTVEEMVWMVSRCKSIINGHVMHGVVTPALIKKITMLSALSTYADFQTFITENAMGMDIVSALKQVCDIYISELPFADYPATRVIKSLTGVESKTVARVLERRPESRSVYPMPSAPSMARVNSFLRGGYRPKQFRSPREHTPQYQQLITRYAPQARRFMKIIDAEGEVI